MNCNETINMGKSHKHNVEWKKSDTKEYILDDSMYMEVQNRQNQFGLLEARIMLLLEGK